MKMSNKEIKSIVSRGYCTGCGLCEAVGGSENVKMEISASGFLRPNFYREIKREKSEAILKSCPGVGLSHKRGIKNYHPIWGPIREIRTGHALDANVRREGSSGGVISAMAIYLIESGKVDFVAQITASKASPFLNEMQFSRSRFEVLSCAGSRYSPSAPLVVLEEMLTSGKRFALIGKPCDIAAIRQYANKDSRVTKTIPYMLSFMCAGIPSVKGSKALLSKLGVHENNLKSFRYRGDGWPGKARAVALDGTVAEMDYAASWGAILNRHLQFRCKLCPDGTGEFADIVGGDAWFGENGYPEFEERDGRSLVITRTDIGEEILLEAEKAGVLVLNKSSVSDVEKMQPYQQARKKMLLGRLIGTKLRMGSTPKFRRLGLVKASLGVRPFEWLRNMLGAYKRAKHEVV